MKLAPYVIINDVDAPQPNMVCQWVPGIGYCYMDRRHGKPYFDGMRGKKATPVEAFGFRMAEDSDGVTRFYRSDAPPTATYRDGKPRQWQHSADSFEWKRLVFGVKDAAMHARHGQHQLPDGQAKENGYG